ncbi:hypothetical protein MKW92_003239 [Papaver armeniacum]|nr:hypothetical protein MKW92_003239 [Papaver armeniacum]
MPSEALESKKGDGETALHVVASAGLTRVAKIRDNGERVPLIIAVCSAISSDERIKEMVKYLCSVTRDEEPSPYSGVLGGGLICLTIDSGLYDIALYLIQRFPNLATEKNEDGYCALEMMAQHPSAFLAERNNLKDLMKSLVLVSISVLDVKRVVKEKLMHKQASALVKCMCTQISLMSSTEILRKFRDSSILETATRFGVVELVVDSVQTFPDLLSLELNNNRTILEEAIIYRQEKIFNLICGINGNVKKFPCFSDESNNTILHLAANLAHSNRLHSVSSAPLQMQRELQWFKEVENITFQGHRQKKNNDGMTGRDLFTEQHKELMEKAEKCMKDTANTCMVVATLITTIVFAAALKVPGGTVSDTDSNGNGTPIFSSYNSFMVFAVADAFALFFSITSVLMFFSILTSRYAEDDFLYSLPNKMIIGLSTLFLSIATTIVAFGAALSIVLGRRWTWVPVFITLVACVPVILFSYLQFQLFIEVFHSTYGPSIFRRQSQRMQWTY